MPAPRQFPRLFGRGVRIAAIEPSEEPKNPRWIQIAYEGVFRGYRDGTVEFTRALFENVVKNFRAHPSFQAGADGVGAENVVHFDYEHASEMDPRVGSIPSQGAPAPAWAMDLEVRDGEDGKAQLWAFAKLGAQALAQITADPPEYQWTSIVLDPNYKHPITGENIGPTMTSVAFTNDPFLQGMTPMSIAASMTIWVDKADTPEQAIIGLREIFGLPQDSEPPLIGEHLQRFVDMSSSGVELDHILDSLRRLFALPTLATRDEVIDAAMAALSYDPSETAAAPKSAATSAETTMSLAKRLAATFKVNEHDETILAAAEKAAQSQDAMDTLMSILGGSDFSSAIANAKEMVEKTAGMGDIVTQLAAAMERIGKVDEEDAVAETEAVVASRVAQMGLSGDAAKVAADTIRPGVLTMRRACIDKDPKVMTEKLAEFRKTYPLPDSDKALLTRRVFAGPNSAQLGLQADQSGNLTPAPVASPVLSGTAPRSDGRNPEHVTMCAKFEGRNETERAVAYLCKERPGFDQLDRGEQIHRAGEWLRATN